jgi:hypothetical protein
MREQDLAGSFGGRFPKPLDTNATGQATFYGCFDNVGCEEGERDGHIDLPNAALLARAKFCDRSFATDCACRGPGSTKKGPSGVGDR